MYFVSIIRNTHTLYFFGKKKNPVFSLPFAINKPKIEFIVTICINNLKNYYLITKIK